MRWSVDRTVRFNCLNRGSMGHATHLTHPDLLTYDSWPLTDWPIVSCGMHCTSQCHWTTLSPVSYIAPEVQLKAGHFTIPWSSRLQVDSVVWPNLTRLAISDRITSRVVIMISAYIWSDVVYRKSIYDLISYLIMRSHVSGGLHRPRPLSAGESVQNSCPQRSGVYW